MHDEIFEYAKRRVSGPAIGMTATAILAAVLLLMTMVFDVWMLANGMLEDQGEPEFISENASLAIRSTWGLLMLVTDASIVLGAIRMMRLQSRNLAMWACGLAIFPCLGPCFVLGLPFGIWGALVLSDEHVHRAFRS